MRNIVDDFVVSRCTDEVEVLYETADFLIVNKPSGLLSLSGRNPLNKDSLHFRLCQTWPSALLVHRLDYGTSGLLIVALNKSFATHVNKQFQAKKVVKSYQALVCGLVEQDGGVIDAPIARDDVNFPKMKICSDTGKPSLTDYRVVERYLEKDWSRLQLNPKTGRTHQLRLHCAHAGFPIIGCDIYGRAGDISEGRLRLHAETISFVNPANNQPMVFESATPF